MDRPITLARLNAMRRLKRATGYITADYRDEMEWIHAISEPYMRRVCELRFVQAHSWAYVAIATHNTEDAVRQMVFRYVRRHESPSEREGGVIVESRK